ncbi:hypothetical protein Y032_0176g533 [Ancylostoma ceylanicum]|uniref:Uncharacterized protein n=1 Tax=Ancylostoma ceylanicum TaxID=53326 RepID=A0A016SU13_9BILA|nr:hypothetical protein Y032_0176g533 [Ancylostoma ceylanicum]
MMPSTFGKEVNGSGKPNMKEGSPFPPSKSKVGRHNNPKSRSEDDASDNIIVPTDLGSIMAEEQPIASAVTFVSNDGVIYCVPKTPQAKIRRIGTDKQMRESTRVNLVNPGVATVLKNSAVLHEHVAILAEFTPEKRPKCVEHYANLSTMVDVIPALPHATLPPPTSPRHLAPARHFTLRLDNFLDSTNYICTRNRLGKGHRYNPNSWMRNRMIFLLLYHNYIGFPFHVFSLPLPFSAPECAGKSGTMFEVCLLYLIFLYWPDKGHHSRPRIFVYGPCPVAVDATPITTV